MFGGHWSSANGDIIKLICHMTSQNNIIEKSCDIISGRYSLYVNIHPNVVAISILVVNICFSNLAGNLVTLHE